MPAPGPGKPLVVIGASTGGPPLLGDLCSGLPPSVPEEKVRERGADGRIGKPPSVAELVRQVKRFRWGQALASSPPLSGR